MNAKAKEAYKENQKTKRAGRKIKKKEGKRAGKSVIITRLTDEETFVKRQLERKPYIETAKDKYGNILVDFSLGSNFEEAGKVCAELFALRDEFEKHMGCIL